MNFMALSALLKALQPRSWQTCSAWMRPSGSLVQGALADNSHWTTNTCNFSSRTGLQDIEAANQELDSIFGPPQAPDAAQTTQFTQPTSNAVHGRSFQTSGDANHNSITEAKLTHVDATGLASMVDVSQKTATSRTATASCIVHLGPVAFDLVHQNKVGKGNVLTTAQLAGIMAAKQTSNLIPLCHNILLSKVDVALELQQPNHSILIKSLVRTVGITGVEMEALTAAGVAALTVYDMCKAASKDIVISQLQLDTKSGGKSGDYQRQDTT